MISGSVGEEAAILGRLHHPNIVALIGSFKDRRHIRHASYCLLMSPMGESDLESFLTIASEPGLTPDLRDRYQSGIQSWYVVPCRE